MHEVRQDKAPIGILRGTDIVIGWRGEGRSGHAECPFLNPGAVDRRAQAQQRGNGRCRPVIATAAACGEINGPTGGRIARRMSHRRWLSGLLDAGIELQIDLKSQN